jgi:hypothetical protein
MLVFMSRRNPKNNLAREPQKTARVLSARALGRPGENRWIVHEEANGPLIRWEGGWAQLNLIEESGGYVRPETNRNISRLVYEHAPIHAVEIWRNPPNGESHVRIFAEIK